LIDNHNTYDHINRINPLTLIRTKRAELLLKPWSG